MGQDDLCKNESYGRKSDRELFCVTEKDLNPEAGLSYPVSTHSFRKYYAYTIYKLHPQDSDNLMIVQTMKGHSDLETTKRYINEIDKKSDKYNYDYADYMLKRRSGEEVEISNSPILSIAWEDKLICCQWNSIKF